MYLGPEVQQVEEGSEDRCDGAGTHRCPEVRPTQRLALCWLHRHALHNVWFKLHLRFIYHLTVFHSKSVFKNGSRELV